MNIFTKAINQSRWIALIIISFLISFSYVTSSSVVFAADTKFEKSVEYKIIVDCSKNEDTKYKNDSECVYAHFGGVTNDRAIRDKCNDNKVKETQKCIDNELLALEINSKYRPKVDNGNKDDKDTSDKTQDTNTNETGSSAYPNTKCFTGLGGELQEKLCPKDAKYPGDKPPEPSKCYYSSITADTGGVDLYEESSCDKSTFKIAPAYENNKAKDNNKPSCRKRSKLSAGWIVCDAVELLSDKMDKFKENIDELMDIDVASMNNSTTDSLKQSWGFFRILASFLLLAVGIIVIMSQAIGGGS